MSINEVRIDGRMGRDPEFRQTSAGEVVKFSIAVTDRKKSGDQWIDGDTNWYNVEYWMHDGDDRSKFAKGQYICLMGRLKTDTWEKDGHKQTRVKIAMTAVESWEFVKGGKASSEPSKPAQSYREVAHKTSEQTFDPNAYADDIPF